MPEKTRIRSDYKAPLDSRLHHRRNRHWLLRWLALGLGCAVLGVVMAKSQETTPAGGDTLSREAAASVVRESLPLPARSAATAASPATATANRGQVAEWREATVDPGDTFGRLLREAGADQRTVHAIATAGEAGRAMARIYPGDTLRLGFSEQERLVRLSYQTAPDRRIEFRREDGTFSGQVIKEPLQRRLEHARGVIRTSLFQAAAEAGVEDRLIMELVSIFAWDIDFVLDIRRGDRFTIVYETFYKNGDRVRTGDIVAAEFENRGEVHRAVRYTTADGETDYYAPDGTSMRKAFLRSPVEFTRISSRFGKRRHPILGTMRNHHGVDYAAPRGTPIRSTGDGRIVFRGRNGGYGNFVVIRHAGKYNTAYGHMRRFARGQRVGSQVEQGEVIGYVGSTGLSTGPHLHYEFRINGVHHNPLTVEFPSVEPIPQGRRDRFRQAIAPLVAQLDSLGRAYAARED